MANPDDPAQTDAPRGVAIPASLAAAIDEATPEAYLAVKHFASLDGFRAASILAVLWHHAGLRIATPPIAARGFLGVDMFFVISGFLIVTLLLRERERTGTISLQAFYLRRSLRIFPIYYGLLLTVGAACAWLVPHTALANDVLGALPFLLTYTNNWVHIAAGPFSVAWSLAAEEQFYLAWPPLEKLLRGNTFKATVAALIVNQAINFGILDRPLAAIGLRHDQLEILQITFTPMLLGVLVAHLLHRPSSFRIIAKWLGYNWSPLPPLATLILLLNVPTHELGGWPRALIQLCMTVLLTTCVMREKHLLRGVLTWSPLRRIGVVSYGIYLYHMLVLVAVGMVLERSPVRFPLDVLVLYGAGSIAAAELSFRLVETPILRIKKRFER